MKTIYAKYKREILVLVATLILGVIFTILFVRVYFASRVVKELNIGTVCKKVIIPIFISSAIPIALAVFMNGYATTIALRIVLTIFIEIVCLVMLWFICFAKTERQTLVNLVKKSRKQ